MVTNTMIQEQVVPLSQGRLLFLSLAVLALFVVLILSPQYGVCRVVSTSSEAWCGPGFGGGFVYCWLR